MAVFKAFVSTAQREFVAQERAKNPAATQFKVGAGWLLPAAAVVECGVSLLLAVLLLATLQGMQVVHGAASAAQQLSCLTKPCLPPPLPPPLPSHRATPTRRWSGCGRASGRRT